LSADLSAVVELQELKFQYSTEMDAMEYIENYIHNQTKKICQIMIDDGFININDEGLYELTRLGKTASNIAEIHPLCLTTLIGAWNNFDSFSVRDLIGLFSCFTDVKVSEDHRTSKPNISNALLSHKIDQLIEVYNKYENREVDLDIRTGIRYEDSLMFDIIDYSMTWAKFDSETDCKYFIQGTISERGISIGDFNKAMLKIVTISKEWIKVFEELGEISTVYKLSQIERLILKYVTTSQSLYV